MSADGKLLMLGLVVQRYECSARIREVGGSNPPQSTNVLGQ